MSREDCRGRLGGKIDAQRGTLDMAITRRAGLSGLGALGALGWRGAARAADADTRNFRFQFTNNQAITSVAIDGKAPLKFMIDSGAFSFSLPYAVATRMALKQVGYTRTGGIKAVVAAPVFAVGEIVISNSFRLRKQLIISPPLQTSGRPYQGLLPGLAFGQSLINFVDHTFQANITPQMPPTDMTVKHAGVAGLFTTKDHNSLFVQAKLDGNPIQLLVDTGAQSSILLFPEYVHAKNLWNHYGDGKLGRYIGTTGSGTGRLVTAEHLEINGFKFEKPKIELTDPADKDNNLERSFQGLIGMELLRRFDLWLDLPRNEVGLRPNALFNDIERYDRSGVALAYPQPTDVEPVVVGLREGGPGMQSGLKIGDRILAFSQGGGDLDALKWVLSGPPDSSVVIKVARPDGEQTVKVVLADAR
jgi:predicted aspartyl protease